MVYFVPIDWDPLSHDAVLARWPAACVCSEPPKVEDAPVRDMLAVIYRCASGRAPTLVELNANRPLSPRALRNDMMIFDLVEQCERGELDVRFDSVARAWTDEVRIWFDVDEWQFLVAHKQVERGSARPEDGGWESSLLTVMSMYGDDYDPSREVNERFRREAAKRFMPGDKFQPQTEEALREMQRAKRRARQR